MKKEFKFNKNGKIELSKEELKTLLDDAYWEGYNNCSRATWTYVTPNWTPQYWTTSGTSGTITTATIGTITNSGSISDGTITLTNTSCNCDNLSGTVLTHKETNL